ncbi:MAG: hypothetical protein NWF14_01090 [Candidatus Bathyarchaeota archaeon]|nr:hypothetical protein [Candidatus Bathyarchaeota archaeon]
MKNKERTIWQELELGFGGSRFRILLQLALNPKEPFTKYALVKATGLRSPTVDSQLKVLLELNWIKEYPFTPKTYQINPQNEVVKHILGLLQKIRHVKSGF